MGAHLGTTLGASWASGTPCAACTTQLSLPRHLAADAETTALRVTPLQVFSPAKQPARVQGDCATSVTQVSCLSSLPTQLLPLIPDLPQNDS